MRRDATTGIKTKEIFSLSLWERVGVRGEVSAREAF